MSSRVFPRLPDLLRAFLGARMVQASAPEEGAQPKERMIKDLTDGEPIAIKELNQTFVDVEAEFRLRISGRDPEGSSDPEGGVDDGVWREVPLAPYAIRPCASDAPDFPDWIDSHPVSAETARRFVSKGLSAVKDTTLWRLRRNWWDLLDAASTPEERLTCRRMIDAFGEDIGRRKAAEGKSWLTQT